MGRRAGRFDLPPAIDHHVRGKPVAAPGQEGLATDLGIRAGTIVGPSIERAHEPAADRDRVRPGAKPSGRTRRTSTITPRAQTTARFDDMMSM